MKFSLNKNRKPKSAQKHTNTSDVGESKPKCLNQILCNIVKTPSPLSLIRLRRMFHLSYDLYLHHDDLSEYLRWKAIRTKKKQAMSMRSRNCFHSFEFLRFTFNVNDLDLFREFRNEIESEKTNEERASIYMRRSLDFSNPQL